MTDKKTGTPSPERHECPRYENQVCCLRAERDVLRGKAVQAVMDLFFALRSVKGKPTLKDLVKLAKRIRRQA